MTDKELRRLQRAADIIEIQMLQADYMSCLDQMNFEKVRDKLMAIDHPEVSFEMVEAGTYEGPEHVRILLSECAADMKDAKGKRGFMPLQNLCTPHIVLSKDGTRAKAQWTLLSPHAMEMSPYPGDEKKLTAYWFGGKYDNEYIKIDDEWKILKVHVIAWFRTPYDQGWVKQPDARRIPPHHGLKPDKPSRYYTYHPDAEYSSDGLYNWGPFLPDDGTF